MIFTVSLIKKELREIEELVQRGEVGSIHDFIKYAIQNQLQLEKVQSDQNGAMYQAPSSDIPDVTIHENSKQPSRHENIQLSNPLTLTATPVNNVFPLDLSDMKTRTKEPIWALKNKYFPLKFLLRVVQKLVSESENGRISIKSLREETNKTAFQLRRELERLDKKLDKKRGERIATGFPTRKKAQSFDRFFKNFAVYVSPSGETIRGMLYELGFIDVVGGMVVLTEDGNNFANLYSPVLDGFLEKKETPSYPFSEKEIEFLYRHIKQKVSSEHILYEFMIKEIKIGNKTPEGLNHAIWPFLEEKFGGSKGVTEQSANSWRGEMTSRMVELQLVEIEKQGGKSFYKLTENVKKFEEM